MGPDVLLGGSLRDVLPDHVLHGGSPEVAGELALPSDGPAGNAPHVPKISGTREAYGVRGVPLIPRPAGCDRNVFMEVYAARLR